MVFISEENYMFRPIAAMFRFWHFSAKRVLYNMPKFLAENCQNLKMAAIGRNM